jgi:hypothetical protein
MKGSSDQRSADLAALLRGLAPGLHEGVWVYAVAPAGTDLAPLAPLASFREAEGLTVIVEEGAARAAGLEPLFRAAWITLGVASELAAVGLTAAVARCLAEARIPCNVVAAARHDHLFVPVEHAAEALGRLRALARSVPG